MRKNHFAPIALFIAFFSLASLSVSNLPLAAGQGLPCDKIKDTDPYPVDDHTTLFVVYESNGSENSFIHIYQKARTACRVLLTTEGSVARFIKNPAGKFPDVEALWHTGASESTSTYYVWNGEKYIPRQRGESERLNKEALEYFKKGEIDRAIKIWEKAKELSIIPGLGFTSNAEVLNNLGFAYYARAKKTGSGRDYERALYFLDGTIEVDPNRWQAYLNLGDLYVERGSPEQAIQSYENVMALNPDYKYAGKIREKIGMLRKQQKVGVQ